MSLLLPIVLLAAPGLSGQKDGLQPLAAEFARDIRPRLESLCLDCHSSETRKGELDLERYVGLDDVRRDPAPWPRVLEMLEGGEMPPRRRAQPTAAERSSLVDWIRRYLDAEAQSRAGDPGRILLRRLSNAEYTYSVRDLTGVELDPAREFPADGAAGEGFTNTGGALVMSPALVGKYLEAAKAIARHAVLLPEGIRFFPGVTRRDWTDEILHEIRALYRRYVDEEGRPPLDEYLGELLRHRERLLRDPRARETVEWGGDLARPYLRRLGRMLAAPEPGSLLLDHVSRRLRRASPDEVAVLAGEIRQWQERLFRFNTVGHFGLIRPRQEPETALENARDFRLEIGASRERDETVLYLVATTAGDGNASDLVVWTRPRIEWVGRPPLPLRQVRAASLALSRLGHEMPEAVTRYLAAAFEIHNGDGDRDPATVALERGVDPGVLGAWLSYLGLAHDGPVEIGQYLTTRLTNGGGYDFVRGWGLAGVADLSLVSNASDRQVKIPGDLNPHRIAVHPRPERRVAVGWKSPVAGRVSVKPRVRHVHPGCGNGVAWSLEQRHGGRREVLRSGTIAVGEALSPGPLGGLRVQEGDWLSLAIDARDGNHFCDLTEIDLTITEEVGAHRVWELSTDCAESIDAANPHADRYGNEGVWHFYSEELQADPASPGIPPDSLLARWLDATDAAEADAWAKEIQALLRGATPPEGTPDALLLEQLQAPGGPFLGRIDLARLAESAPAADLPASDTGVDPEAFGRRPGGPVVGADDLLVTAPSVVEVRLPRGIFGGAEFVTSAALHATEGQEGSVQVEISGRRRRSDESLLAGVPILVRSGSRAEARVRRSFTEFRELFPVFLCYPRIVPVDEVVTLVLFHREDGPLRQLALEAGESARLDRLWRELRHVSRDALTMVDAYEQLMEYATQDSDPRLFEPLREPIRQRAEAFAGELEEAEPGHVDAVTEFATRAYRRPLTAAETGGLRELYRTLREDEGIPHGETIRLLVARVLTAPAFLYRLERPAPGSEPGPVSSWELATRLSYFLWSSVPDRALRETAARGELQNPDVLLAQTRRMLRDSRTRRLAIEFACQWLQIRDFDEHDEKSERHFPTFPLLRRSMHEESIRFFTDLFREDGPVLSILDADHAFLDGALARHYGVPGVEGPGWHRVEGMKELDRGGILGQASILAKQAGASRTSPTLRGNWVYEVLLGERLPRPPDGVPRLPEEETATEGLTVRQLVEKHSSDPACSGCHVRVDPFGFALEAFDAIGRRRETDLGGRPVDTRTTLADGTRIEGPGGLRDYLLTARREAFVRQFCRKLLGYALGRAVQLSDEPVLSAMSEALRSREYRVSVAIEAIVLSRQFREIRGRDAPERHIDR